MLERLLDSVIIIDHLNGIDAATEFVLGLDPTRTAISVITRAEILVGNEASDEKLMKAFLDQYRLLIIDKTVADLTATLRKTYHWKLPDAFQAAISITHKIKLTTRNTKDFDPAKHDFIEIPYSL